MTPDELLGRLAAVYTLSMDDGSMVEPGGKRYTPHAIMASFGDPSGETANQVRNVASHLIRTGETGSYVLVQYLDVVDAAVFAGILGDNPFEEAAKICGVEDDAAGFFQERYQINGFCRRVTPAIQGDLNDCSEFQLVLIPESK